MCKYYWIDMGIADCWISPFAIFSKICFQYFIQKKITVDVGGAELCYDLYCNLLIAFHRSSSKRYLQYFYQQFWISHRNHHGKCGDATGTETTVLNLCHKPNLSIFFSIYCSTCRSACKCYLQHIYQQLWFNSRNYNGEWEWPLKPSCERVWHNGNILDISASAARENWNVQY